MPRLGGGGEEPTRRLARWQRGVGEEPNQVQSASLSLAAVLPVPHLQQPESYQPSGTKYADTSPSIYRKSLWVSHAVGNLTEIYTMPPILMATAAVSSGCPIEGSSDLLLP